MKLENTFSVPVPVDETWRVLLDIERVAPCVPGATLTSRDGDSFSGKVKVKLGPIGLTYGGTATFLSLDEAAKVAVIEASGRETRGGGTAKAVVTCRLVGTGGATDVLVETDLAITGKPAQFGRAALADVTAILIGQFAANLASEITGAGTAEGARPHGEPAAPPAPAATPDPGETAGGAPAANGVASVPAPADGAPPPPAAPPRVPAAHSHRPGASHRAAEPIDLLGTAGGGVLKRVGPSVAGTVLLVVLLLLWRRRT
ncbi:SRPBCC family protein [Parafrankia discariae]|uniref:SRPBCC family protein n=1 Tax=Parafrankia discariae TaxID=365528 RepID=UPI000366D422|nr:SRPBCC family protein [Parafrankia discariae]